MTIDLDSVKTFFDPHPGFAGAVIPIPAMVKNVADELNGQSVSLRKAVSKIKTVTRGTVSVEDGWIVLELHQPGGIIHGFRVICFK